MMLQAIILGIIQGLTEFLPISSSGHLAILEAFFKVNEPLTLTAFLHFGTLVATLVFFRRPIQNIIKGIIMAKASSIKYVVCIIIGTLPIVIFALFFKSWVESSFKDVKLIAILLGITGLILLLTAVTKKQQRPLNFLSAGIIGIGQMFAIFPGLSRSGLTISAGLFSGVSPEESFQFSFLLSLPAVFGANILELRNISQIADYHCLIVGILCSFFSGLCALKILQMLVLKKFYIFGIYCMVVSLIILLCG